MVHPKRPSIGDRVLVRDLHAVTYLQKRIEHGYCHLHEGAQGIVVRIAGTGKIGIQFDHYIWTGKADGTRSNFANGCHGSGRPDSCAYLPERCVVVMLSKTPEMEPIGIIPGSQEELLLLV